MRLLELARRHPRVVAFGMLCRFTGGVGQTFFISLFAPQLMDAHALERTGFASLYAAATLGSAIVVSWVGRGVDVLTLRAFTILNALALALACLGIAWAPGAAGLFVSLLVLRLTGQGLMAHITTTSMARFFVRARGTALGLTFLGHPAAEAVFPLLATTGIAALGWRQVWTIAAAAAAGYALVVVALLAGRDTRPEAFTAESTEDAQTSAAGTSGEAWTRTDALMDLRIWALLPFWLAPPFVLTGMFFHQTALADEKAWPLAWLASSFVGYAGAQIALAFLAGPLVDRFSARRLLPVHLLPFVLGLLALAVTDARPSAWVYMVGCGLSVGFGVTVKPAYLASLFGTRNLGGIRSLLLTVAVLSTAAAPPVFAALLEAGVTFATLAGVLAGAVVVASVVALFAMRALDAEPRPRSRPG
jgi:sugar phosphate permease